VGRYYLLVLLSEWNIIFDYSAKVQYAPLLISWFKGASADAHIFNGITYFVPNSVTEDNFSILTLN
jgi:hypothetical protein